MNDDASVASVELPAEQRKVLRQSGLAALAALVCAAVLAAATIWLPRWLDFPDEMSRRIA
jgi:drug/metabolite transporter (DMT)-like permease